MKLNIPEHCEIRWQAALAVLEDLIEDVNAPFNQAKWADELTFWEKINDCGSAACFGGYISISPYCRALGFPERDFGSSASRWLMDYTNGYDPKTGVYLSTYLFDSDIGHSLDRAGTLAELTYRIKSVFKNSTGRKLVAPLTFWID